MRNSGEHSDPTLQRLRDTVLAFYGDASRHPPETAAFLQRAIEAVRAAAPTLLTPPATGLPVSRHLARAFAAASDGPLGAIADALRAAEPSLTWLQNPNYTAASIGAAFVANYGYVEFVGPGRAFQSLDALVGFLLLGPDIHYPDHAHPAQEVYHVVAGSADWWRGDRDWTTLHAGTPIHHHPHVRHAMHTGDEPMLALYCWMGDVGVAAALSGTGSTT